MGTAMEQLEAQNVDGGMSIGEEDQTRASSSRATLMGQIFLVDMMLARGRRPAISKGNRLSVQNQRQLQHSVGGLYSAPTVVECFDNICVNLEEFAARFEKLECTEEDYEEELECIEKVFSPWVEKCKQFCYILFLWFNSLLHYYYQVQYTGAYQLLKFMLQPRIYQHQKYISQFLYGRDRWVWRLSREEGAREAVQRRSWRIREGLCWPGSVPHEDEHISLLTPSELSFFFQLMAGLGGLTGARFSHHMLGSDISSSLLSALLN